MEINRNNIFAHSGDFSKNIKRQTYRSHIKGMLIRFNKIGHILPPFLQEVVKTAILYHDMGKLQYDCQKVLSLKEKDETLCMPNHVDAGSAYCIKMYNKTGDKLWIFSSYLIHCHHIGLQNFSDIFVEKRDGMSFSSKYEIIEENIRDFKEYLGRVNKDITDSLLDSLINISQICIKDLEDGVNFNEPFKKFSPLDFRVAFSLLVECDHYDTSKHYGFKALRNYSLKANKRIRKLDNHINRISSNTVRSDRSRLYNLCKNSKIENHNFHLVCAPTGSGKTYSLMRLALKIAESKKRSKIHFIIPFTNIIDQSLKEYRNVVCLYGEDKEKAINGMHSKIDFENELYRGYSHLFDSPINISTSVQFFQSLLGSRTSSVRKIKNFANSVIVFDEYHTSLPHALWGLALETLKELCDKYNVDVIFGSGSHVLYWELGRFNLDIQVNDIIGDEDFKSFKESEINRVSYKKLNCANEESFYRFVENVLRGYDKIPDTVFVFNTIHNALVSFRTIELMGFDADVFYLSSHIKPSDRLETLNKIKESLNSKRSTIVVSTSIIECGVDISFDIGFREMGSLMSSIQLGGRVNRSSLNKGSFIYDFEISGVFNREVDTLFTPHYNLYNSIQARRDLDTSFDNCTTAIEREIDSTRRDHQKILDLRNNENMMNFRSVSEIFRVIDGDTVSVIFDKKMFDKLKSGVYIPSYLLNKDSISVYKNKIEEYNQFFEPLTDGDCNLYLWVGEYSPKYGIIFNS